MNNEQEEYIKYAKQLIHKLQSSLSSERDCIADLLKSGCGLRKDLALSESFCKSAAADYEAARAEYEKELARLADYDTRLTEVMPEDFKDWHQNSKDEWPLIAAYVIKRLRNELENTEQDAAQSDVDTVRALHERNELREQYLDSQNTIRKLRVENERLASRMAELEHTASDIALALEGAEANRNWDAAEYRKAEDAINGWSGSTTKKDVHIQFCSYELVLLPYGSYYISDTTGG